MPSLRSSQKHLYVALTDADTNGRLVVVNVTKQAPDKDQSCVLQTGDHPFIKTESVINYADAIISSEDNINRGARGRIVEFDPVSFSGEVLGRIQQGALTSPQTETDVKEFVTAFLSL